MGPTFQCIVLFQTGKYWLNDPNDAGHHKVKDVPFWCINIGSPNFQSVSLYNYQFSSYGPILRQLHRTIPKDLGLYRVRCTLSIFFSPRFPYVSPFRFKESHFWVLVQFWDKWPEWPQVALNRTRSNVSHMSVLPCSQSPVRFYIEPGAVSFRHEFDSKSGELSP